MKLSFFLALQNFVLICFKFSFLQAKGLHYLIVFFSNAPLSHGLNPTMPLILTFVTVSISILFLSLLFALAECYSYIIYNRRTKCFRRMFRLLLFVLSSLYHGTLHIFIGLNLKKKVFALSFLSFFGVFHLVLIFFIGVQLFWGKGR